jgi:hypothetical protein
MSELKQRIGDVTRLTVVKEQADTYRLYRSEFILQRSGALAEESLKVHRKFEAAFPGANSTASTTAAEQSKYQVHDGYRYYNVFALAAPSALFLDVHRCLVAAIRDYVPERNLYMQAWLNCQAADEVLNWHSHEGYKYHGYIALDPQDTKTEFEEYEIDNKPGQIYIGQAFLRHRVVNRSPYPGKRITIGFDIIEPMDRSITNRGFIPLAL